MIYCNCKKTQENKFLERYLIKSYKIIIIFTAFINILTCLSCSRTTIAFTAFNIIFERNSLLHILSPISKCFNSVSHIFEKQTWNKHFQIFISVLFPLKFYNASNIYIYICNLKVIINAIFTYNVGFLHPSIDNR